MARYRIYADKVNCILENYPTVNTGLNPASELWYGENGIARTLIRYDFDDYVAKYTAGHAPALTAATVTVHINTLGPSVETLATGVDQAQSHDLTLYPMITEWDAGSGHDFIGLDTIAGYSNWNSATTLNAWVTPGGDYDTAITAATQHFDLGSEDFSVSGASVDVDSLWSQATGTNYGYMFKFTDAYEDLSGSNKTMLQHYTKNSSTVFTPYIEVQWDDQIAESRASCYGAGETIRLYAILKHDDMLRNAYNVKGVEIASPALSDNIVIGPADIHNPSPGVYYADFTIPESHPAGTLYSDDWVFDLDIVDNEVIFTQTFTSSTTNSAWNVTDSFDPANYIIDLPKLKASYREGDIVYLPILVREPYSSTRQTIKRMEYRIVMTQKDVEEESFCDWQDVSYRDSGNFIIIDTSWFIRDCDYRIEFKYYDSGSCVYYKPDYSTFKVV